MVHGSFITFFQFHKYFGLPSFNLLIQFIYKIHHLIPSPFHLMLMFHVLLSLNHITSKITL
ncbi:hypothetical protein D0Y65_050880 [Glycine soja]|uniref:Uncharacterized protein n=1 Tax=Glycine soja TaxID=3848 RepID=A0A445FDT9_GLYSO|nr:hypothetical protein D0Y65_050880 [Glycine soja]